MEAARLKRIQALFLAAAELSPAEQRAYLEAQSGADAGLVAEVLAMLEEDRAGGSLLDSDVAHVAGRILGDAADPSGGVPAGIRTIGPYRLIRVLGEGGMGVVYLARRDDLGNLVAIKILRDAWLSPARRERFVTEQRTLAQLNHPSIARIYDADTLPDGTPWFAMEYVEGVSLTEYCRGRSCPISERLRLFRAVAEAVQFAHEHAIIHRDLKPSNILVTPAGGVRLLDFGIAKQIRNLDQPAEQTRTELRLMTPAYAAPEQIRGGRVGIFTDVYALGVMLYELLADRLPFDLSTRTPAEAERIVAEQEPPKPSAVASRTGVSPRNVAWADLDVLCLTAIHKDAQRRYRSVEALIRDIDHYRKGEPLEARPDSWHYRCGKFLGRNWRPVSAAAAAAIALVALVVFFTLRLSTARNTAVAAAARMQHVQQFMLNLFQGGDRSAGPAAGLRVVSLLDRGVKEAQALKREPEVQAELYLTLGGIYQRLGNFAQADALLNAAIERRRAIYGPDHSEVAQSQVALGLLRVAQARFEDAEQLIRQGLDRITRTRPPDKNATAKATAALGKVFQARGSYAKAIPLLEQAVQLQTGTGAPSLDLAGSLKDLADTRFYAGHYDICENLTQRTLALHRELVGERHPLVADDLINLGAVQFERGRYVEAERFYRQALAINEGWYGGSNQETASTLSMLSRSLVFQRRYDEAVELSERALVIQEQVFGAQHPKVANVVNELGTVALQRGKFDEAEARFRRMAAIYKHAYGERHYLYPLSLANLASVYLARNQFVRAEQIFREVIQRYSGVLSPEHQNVAIARIKLGRALLGQKRYAAAESEILAGYQTLRKQTSPTVSWLNSARSDLVRIYEALKQPEKANSFRKLAGEVKAPRPG